MRTLAWIEICSFVLMSMFSILCLKIKVSPRQYFTFVCINITCYMSLMIINTL